MVDFGRKPKKTDICTNAASDTRKVPIGIWVRETKPITERLTAFQNEGKATYAAFGATALGALGYSRSTKDVDIVIKPGTLGFDELSAELAKEFGLTKCPRGEDRVQMLVKEVEGYHYVVELWNDYIYVMDCDKEMWKRTTIGQELGFPAITLSVEDMVSSKLGRYFVEHKPEDITDIAFLLRQYGIKDYNYFVDRIQKIKRNGQTIDDFLFEEISELTSRLGRKETIALHAEIVKRKLYRQLLERIMFKFAKESKTIDEIADKTLLPSGAAEAILNKLGITNAKAGFEIPDNPNAIISSLVK